MNRPQATDAEIFVSGVVGGLINFGVTRQNHPFLLIDEVRADSAEFVVHCSAVSGSFRVRVEHDQ